MRSGTSFFNSTLYRKTMGRFWPFWILYGLIWLFTLPLNLMNQYFNYVRGGMADAEAQAKLLDLARNIPHFLTAGVSLSLVAGVLCAMAVFGYLYSSRSACMIHALPLRRETLFATQYFAGLSFLLLPHLVVGVLTLTVELSLLPSSLWGAAVPSLALWLLVQSGTALFFFSFAAFCAMFTGHVLALPAFYGILNCLVFVIYSLLSELMAQFFYGYPAQRMGGALVEFCTPAYALTEACRWSSSSSFFSFIYPSSASESTLGLSAPVTVTGYAVAGVVFALLALLVYRYRHVESAGDVVAIALVRPVFKYGVSFCSGLCFGILTNAFFGWGTVALSLCVLFWAAVGYFAAEMLLEKTFRVLRSWKGCLAMTCVLALLCLSFFLDLFGVENRVPDAGQVSSLSLSISTGYPYDSSSLSELQITDPDQIQQIVDLHQAIVQDKDRADYSGSGYVSGEDSISFEVTYTLKNGFTLERQYYSVPIFLAELNQFGSVTWRANQLVQNRNLVALSYHFDSYERGRLVEVYLNNVYNRSIASLDTLYLDGLADQLWTAMRKDFEEGHIGVRYLFDDEERLENTCRTDLCFTWEMPTTSQNSRPDAVDTASITITLTPQANHTLAVLQESGALGDTYSIQPHTSEDSNLPQENDTVSVPLPF
ncbi:MAG: hypothetical protein VB071_08125 [Lawsonibacter sp.]|nr:hypothetical protein [Lawsonibacter sp.]